VSIALTLSRLALVMGLIALFLAGRTTRTARPRAFQRRRFVMALGTFALGLAMFALFYGLIAACDRL
jgi:hypothetical protein